MNDLERLRSLAIALAAALALLLAGCGGGEGGGDGGDGDGARQGGRASGTQAESDGAASTTDGAATRAAVLTATTEALATDYSCTACHEASASVASRIPAAPAPDLTSIGARMSPQYMRTYLAAPHEVKPTTMMADVLHSLPDEEREETVENLVHFLQARGGPFAAAPTDTTQARLDAGRDLYDTIGCRACHATEDGERLATMTSVAALTTFLLDPHATRPSGRMPGMALSSSEAGAIARYLLRSQLREHEDGPDGGRKPGLQYEYFEGDFDSDDGTLAGEDAVDAGTIESFDISVRRRDDHFGFRFSGEIEVPIDGEYVFYTTSDDGSWLWIGGRRIVDNGGLHGPTERSGQVFLKAGRHAITVTMFEKTGGEELSVRYSGPNLTKREIPAEVLSYRPLTLVPPVADEFTIDTARVEAGAASFASLGCAACHEPTGSTLAAPALVTLNPGSAATGAGCLAEDAERAPRWTLGAAERSDLRDLLGNLDALAGPRAPAEEIDYTLDRLQCLQCHRRDTRGGPTGATREAFQGTADLGDEGRIPPRLTEVGHRLKPQWLRRVLIDGESVRPYMLTRMPRFAAADVEPLIDLFEQVDARPGDDVEPEFSPAAAEVGRTLIGKDGLGCITCHYYAGHGDPRIHAVDLAHVVDRIKPGWQKELNLNPQVVSPGTRMTAFWPPGESIFPDLLDGDAERQVDAIRMYMSLGPNEPLPKGVVADRSAYDLDPRDGVIVFGAFLKGLSARVQAVGHPQGVHYAFDVDNVRLARTWRGSFINAQGTWQGRAGQLESPDSMDVIDMPLGAPFAVLADPAAPWPPGQGREASWRMIGSRRDAERRPQFRYRGPGLEIEESPLPGSFGDRDGLTRRFSIRRIIDDGSPTGGGAWMRALVADSIEERDGWYHGADGVRVRVRGGRPRVRTTEDGSELLVEVTAGTVAQNVEMEVDITW